MSHYKHLSIEERESLYLGVNQGKSIRSIARELKRSASSLSRELRRNKISHRPYSPSRAQRRYQRCKKNCGRKPILADQEKLQLIRRLLREEWSPEQIQYRLKHEKNSLQISYTTIYRALSSGQIDGHSPSYIRKYDRYSFHLRRKGKNAKKTVKPTSRGNTRSNTAFLNAHKPQNNAVSWDTGKAIRWLAEKVAHVFSHRRTGKAAFCWR